MLAGFVYLNCGFCSGVFYMRELEQDTAPNVHKTSDRRYDTKQSSESGCTAPGARHEDRAFSARAEAVRSQRRRER